ncbi:hypothetical protein RCL1_001430 [Eukaryota sp. TZLM3-RCL]
MFLRRTFSTTVRRNQELFHLTEHLKQRAPPLFALDWFRDLSASFERRGLTSSEWDSKFYVLKGPFLFQFDENVPRASATDIIPLRGATVTSPIKPKEAPPGSDLALYIGLKSDYFGKVFLRCSRRSQIRTWIEILSMAIEIDHQKYHDGYFVNLLPRLYTKNDIIRFKSITETIGPKINYDWTFFFDDDASLRGSLNIFSNAEKKKIEGIASNQKAKEEAKRKTVADGMRGMLLSKEWKDAFYSNHGGSFQVPSYTCFYDSDTLTLTHIETNKEHRLTWTGFSSMVSGFNLGVDWDGLVLNWKSGSCSSILSFFSEFDIPDDVSLGSVSSPLSDEEHTPTELRTSDLTGTVSELSDLSDFELDLIASNLNFETSEDKQQQLKNLAKNQLSVTFVQRRSKVPNSISCPQDLLFTWDPVKNFFMAKKGTVFQSKIEGKCPPPVVLIAATFDLALGVYRQMISCQLGD